MERPIRDELVRRVELLLRHQPPGWSSVPTAIADLPTGWQQWNADTNPVAEVAAAIVLVVNDMDDTIELEARWSRVGSERLPHAQPRWAGEDLTSGDSAAVRAQAVDSSFDGVHDLAAASAPLLDLDDAGPAIDRAVDWVAGILDEVLLPYLDRIARPPQIWV